MFKIHTEMTTRQKTRKKQQQQLKKQKKRRNKFNGCVKMSCVDKNVYFFPLRHATKVQSRKISCLPSREHQLFDAWYMNEKSVSETEIYRWLVYWTVTRWVFLDGIWIFISWTLQNYKKKYICMELNINFSFVFFMQFVFCHNWILKYDI